MMPTGMIRWMQVQDRPLLLEVIHYVILLQMVALRRWPALSSHASALPAGCLLPRLHAARIPGPPVVHTPASRPYWSPSRLHVPAPQSSPLTPVTLAR